MIGGFTDKVKRLTSSIGRDADVDSDIPGIVNSQLGRPYLRLLPPMEMEGMAVRIGSF